MKKPSYTKYPLYCILEDLANKAGIKIEYEKLDERQYGKYSKDEKRIVMSDTNIYCNENDEDGGYNASFSLAHEIGHALIEETYFYDEELYDRDIVTYKIIDSDADKVGGALLKYALMVSEQEQCKIFESFDSKTN